MSAVNSLASALKGCGIFADSIQISTVSVGVVNNRTVLLYRGTRVVHTYVSYDIGNLDCNIVPVDPSVSDIA